ncbi:helix-turn-helix transcriptional regulator [Agriterribacter sp.]|uniref:helix-turn-helix domain-containing protein n=1 Tax=Agriterribacter sp. TaxID=2821509 RepID=UPI002B648BD9|nr:helix-turn-helix transcriptional regulator [Agriterribacter sp.]HTN08283.1 helix-turn-helix transcriptional regulator [Agriterribacter sp.]
MEAASHTDVLPIGRKIEKVRRLRAMTQTQLGDLLGISKQAVSKMEQTKQMDDDKINEVANALGVTADTIRNFNEEATFNIIANTYHNHSSSVNYQLNPIEKIIALYQEQIALYERMLKEKDELIDKLVKKK